MSLYCIKGVFQEVNYEGRLNSDSHEQFNATSWVFRSELSKKQNKKSIFIDTHNYMD